MDRPPYQFTKSGKVSIAYQCFGDGPVDLVFATGWLSSMHPLWASPRFAAFVTELASFSRVILFDKRGVGMSDRDVGSPTLEDRAEDVLAVLDAVGSTQAVVMGLSEGANMTAMFAATYPERVRSIILVSCRPCVAWRPNWQNGMRRSDFDTYLEDLLGNWGGTTDLDVLAPSIAQDPVEQEAWRIMLLASASPSTAEKIARQWYEIDIRDVLPVIHAPAMVLHRLQERSVRVEEAQLVADLLPNGRFVGIEGDDHIPWAGDTDAVLREIRGFVNSEAAPPTQGYRALHSIMMTDIVGSSDRAAAIGDDAWTRLIQAHFNAGATLAARHNGTLVKTLGDGMLFTFLGPTLAIDCARALRETARDQNLSLRIGLHSGECLRRGDDLSGLAINLAARIMAEAAPGEILVSGTVQDLAFGSDLVFDALAPRPLKGIPGDWPLFRLAHSDRLHADRH